MMTCSDIFAKMQRVFIHLSSTSGCFEYAFVAFRIKQKNIFDCQLPMPRYEDPLTTFWGVKSAILTWWNDPSIKTGQSCDEVMIFKRNDRPSIFAKEVK